LAEHHDDVVAWLDAGETFEACEEVRALVTAFASRSPADGLHPIDAAGRLAQEDVCILEPFPEGYVLTAGSVCFPSRWRLRDKLGRPLLSIHAPVPGYAETIGVPTDATLARLRVDKPVWRLNWSLLDDPTLYQPTGHGSSPSLPSGDVGRSVWLRVERQTLRRMPATQAIVFTIRTVVATLADAVGAGCERATAMATTLRTMPRAMVDYKAMGGPWLDAVLEWLDERADVDE
jgi:hypothetical protein